MSLKERGRTGVNSVSVSCRNLIFLYWLVIRTSHIRPSDSTATSVIPQSRVRIRSQLSASRLELWKQIADHIAVSDDYLVPDLPLGRTEVLGEGSGSFCKERHSDHWRSYLRSRSLA